MWRTPENEVQVHLLMREVNSSGDLFPYHHVVDQMQWVSEVAKDNSNLSFGKPPSIYYDRKIIYHPTSPNGCRFTCNFPLTYDNLGRGDVAVFSEDFSADKADELKKRGVLIAFETGESPFYMPHLSPTKWNKIDIFINYMALSPVPFMYPMFLRESRAKYQFSREEKARILSKTSTHLLPAFHGNRSRLIAWVVSNSLPSNNRKEFAKAISTFIPVDIYGRKNLPLPNVGNVFQWLSRKYKFYLSFENSNCRNYITEKVQRNALRNDMVPIVLGAYKEDYESALPPHSYINVDDFQSIRQLTDYLLYLNANDTAYASYFAWKEHGRILEVNRPDCRLCGFAFNLNAGKAKLLRQRYSYFTDANVACFTRPLLPLQ